MVQFYTLSVLANLLTGWLVGSEPGEGSGFLGQLRKLLEDNTLKFGLGLASLVIAVFKVLSPIEGDVPIVGDLVPAAAGLATGAILLLDFFAGSTVLQNETLNRLGTQLLGYRRYVGVAAAAAGLLHFVMPRVVVL